MGRVDLHTVPTCFFCHFGALDKLIDNAQPLVKIDDLATLGRPYDPPQ